jgi:hypothetical protein
LVKQHQNKMKDITDEFETELRSIFGQNAWVAYGDSKVKSNFLGDNFKKDMLMAIVAPIRGLSTGLILAVKGILNIVFCLEAEDSIGRLKEGGASLLAGVALMLTAIISPVARIYNALTRKAAPYLSKEETTLLTTQESPTQETGDIITQIVQTFKTMTAQKEMKNTLNEGREDREEGNNVPIDEYEGPPI